MADAYQCDRCGNHDTGDPVAELDTTLVRGDFHLCEPCARDFKRWANNEPANPLENAMKASEMHQ